MHDEYPVAHALQFLEAQMNAYHMAQVCVYDGRELVIVVRNADNEIVARIVHKVTQTTI